MKIMTMDDIFPRRKVMKGMEERIGAILKLMPYDEEVTVAQMHVMVNPIVPSTKAQIKHILDTITIYYTVSVLVEGQHFIRKQDYIYNENKVVIGFGTCRYLRTQD